MNIIDTYLFTNQKVSSILVQWIYTSRIRAHVCRHCVMYRILLSKDNRIPLTANPKNKQYIQEPSGTRILVHHGFKFGWKRLYQNIFKVITQGSSGSKDLQPKQLLI